MASEAITDILAERARQAGAEGWTPAHDDAHDAGQMALAAASYAQWAAALNASVKKIRDANPSPSWPRTEGVAAIWPWSPEQHAAGLEQSITDWTPASSKAGA